MTGVPTATGPMRMTRRKLIVSAPTEPDIPILGYVRRSELGLLGAGLSRAAHGSDTQHIALDQDRIVVRAAATGPGDEDHPLFVHRAISSSSAATRSGAEMMQLWPASIGRYRTCGMAWTFSCMPADTG